MATHVVFTLHGMGEHKTGWSKEGVERFQEVAREIGYPEDELDSLEFVEINYNHLFIEYLKQHELESGNLASFVEKFASIGRSSFYKGLYDYAASVPDGDDFVVNALGDVFLYRATEYEQVVISFVTHFISKTLKDTADVRAWSLIGHSLGTRVLHDSVDVLMDDPEFFTAFGKPTCIAMIANVCHLLAYRPKDLWERSRVFPNDSLDSGGCFRYVNAMHPLDPFMWIRPFTPTPLWGQGASGKADFLNVDIRDSDLRRNNPHSFAGYVENPRVAKALCQGLGTRNSHIPAFRESDLASAMTRYEGQTLKGQVATVRQSAIRLRDQRSSRSFKEFVTTLREFEVFLGTLGISLSGGDKP